MQYTGRLRPACVLIFALLVPGLYAQFYTGSLSGTVADPSGAVIPNATATLTDVSRGLTYSATSNASGQFVIRNLPPSTYNLSVAVAGFATFTRENIIVNVNQDVDVPFELTVAGAGTTVAVVESGAPFVSTEDAVTGQTVNRTFINDLPLVGRAVYDLARLAPGVSEPRGSSGATTTSFHKAAATRHRTCCLVA